MIHYSQLSEEEQKDIRKALLVPFEPQYIEWVPVATYDSDKGWICKANPYADVRAYQRRLDEVCGKNWSVRVKPLPNPAQGNIGVVVAVTIYGRTIEDVGEASATDNNAWTSAFAQGFKRACSAQELGRYLYDDQSWPWVPYNKQRSQIEKEGIEKLNGQYQGWYMHVMGKTKPAERQQQQQQQQQQPVTSAPPAQTSTAPAQTSTFQGPPGGPPPDGSITDATKQAIYALAKEIFGEAEWIAGLGWYVEAYTRVNTPTMQTGNPDLLPQTSAAAVLEAMGKNKKLLPDYWTKAKASAAANAAKTTTQTQRPVPTQPAGRPS